MRIEEKLKCPLFTSWSRQYVRRYLADVTPGTGLQLSINDEPTPFQYTGRVTAAGAEVMLPLAFAPDESKHLVFTTAASDTELGAKEIPMTEGVTVGSGTCPLRLAPPEQLGDGWTGPFAGFANFPFESDIQCAAALESVALRQINDGPLFTDYHLLYRFAGNRRYELRFRCYKLDSYIEVAERFSLQMGGHLRWALNPNGQLDRIVSHGVHDFESDGQPIEAALGEPLPKDVLCRLQMPPLGSWAVPNNRCWFAFYSSRETTPAMLGIMGLYGDDWVEPVANMPEVRDRAGDLQWHADLTSGARHWLLYHGPVETQFTPKRRFVFHRLHAEFNALRLEQHLELDGRQLFDEKSWQQPALFADEPRAKLKARIEALPCLRRVVNDLAGHGDKHNGQHLATLRYMLEPNAEHHELLLKYITSRFERWVHQFQGYRSGEPDYHKSVIGFSRYLRGLLLGYELLRRDQQLDDMTLRKLNAYAGFAAKRITDEARWPHRRTTLHPDHPESVRDLYTYGGEHRVDRLYWTNSLPNFQSDPLCALAHLSAIFPEHPEAAHWEQKALDDIDAQLDAYCGDSGAWEESINYALYTLSYLIITFRALKHRRGIDYFNDKRVRRFVGWLCRFYGPLDKRFGVSTFPAIGNAVLPSAGGEYLLAYAAELSPDDPLRAQCMAIYHEQAETIELHEHYPNVLAAMAPNPGCGAREPLTSEHMDELGVAMRDNHLAANESYLFQKIGFWKDHYENDETAFNWYAKGTPLVMEYGTYTRDAGAAAAHNLVEIPDQDPLRRGYLKAHMFSSMVDFTHCEVPVTLKLLWGRVREFAEIDAEQLPASGQHKTPFNYIGDDNPVGPKTWRTRLLVFVKPDYVVLYDRIYGDVPHRYNLHVVADEIARDGDVITAQGRFDLDLECHVQHPRQFRFESGDLVPQSRGNSDDAGKHSQSYFRLYNDEDGKYRTLLFAREREREVSVEGLETGGFVVRTPMYCDYVFADNEWTSFANDEVAFCGRVGWIRRRADGSLSACVQSGDMIRGFGRTFRGRGPWTYNMDGTGTFNVLDGPPRSIVVEDEYV